MPEDFPFIPAALSFIMAGGMQTKRMRRDICHAFFSMVEFL